MTHHTPRELLEKDLITEDQFKKIEPITSGKILSVFYELRILLYLGVMMFTSGTGVLIYQNIGEVGHLISILLLALIMVSCFWYVIKQGRDYSGAEVQSPNVYFDYVLLLACLLFVSIQGYIQFQYSTFTEFIEWNTLITAIFYFYIAYRYDHIGVLSLAIVALASFWGLRVAPQKWYSINFFDQSDLHITAMVFATSLAAIVFYLDKKSIKRHFTFTYLNFCFLIFFVGALAGIFVDSTYDLLFVFLIYIACVFAWHQSRVKKSFLFLLYAFVVGYIATTYLLGKYIFNDEPALWYYYFLISCGGVIYLIIRYKRLFKRS
jgi:Predicted membrane protein (DUF2157)